MTESEMAVVESILRICRSGKRWIAAALVNGVKTQSGSYATHVLMARTDSVRISTTFRRTGGEATRREISRGERAPGCTRSTVSLCPQRARASCPIADK